MAAVPSTWEREALGVWASPSAPISLIMGRRLEGVERVSFRQSVGAPSHATSGLHNFDGRLC